MASRHAAKRENQEYQTLTGLCEKNAAPQGGLRNVEGVTEEQWGFTQNPRRELNSLHPPHGFAACREAGNSRVSDFDRTLQSTEGETANLNHLLTKVVPFTFCMASRHAAKRKWEIQEPQVLGGAWGRAPTYPPSPPVPLPHFSRSVQNFSKSKAVSEKRTRLFFCPF